MPYYFRCAYCGDETSRNFAELDDHKATHPGGTSQTSSFGARFVDQATAQRLRREAGHP